MPSVSILRLMLHMVVAGFTIGAGLPLMCGRRVLPRDAFLTGLLIALLSETIGFVSGRIAVVKGIDFRAVMFFVFAACVAAGAGIIKARHNVSTGSSVCLSVAQLVLAGGLGLGIALLENRLS